MHVCMHVCWIVLSLTLSVSLTHLQTDPGPLFVRTYMKKLIDPSRYVCRQQSPTVRMKPPRNHQSYLLLLGGGWTVLHYCSVWNTDNMHHCDQWVHVMQSVALEQLSSMDTIELMSFLVCK